MPNTETTMDTASDTSFSPTELAALRDRRNALDAQWVDTVRREIQATQTDGKAVLEAELSADAQATIRRIQSERDTVDASIRRDENAKQRADYVKSEESMTARAPRYRDALAKANARFMDNLIAVGQGEYRNPKPNAEGGVHPGTLLVDQPLIAPDPVTGRNMVHPVPAVFPRRGENRQADLEASFRLASMIAEDKAGRYDPLTGMRHQDKVVQADIDLSDYTQLTQGGMLYLYEVQQNELAQYVDLKQTPNINNYLIDRRTAVPNASLVAEGAAITNTGTDSTFDTLNVSPSKFAYQKGMSYESGMTAEPWSMAQTIVMDGGIGLGNGVGAQMVTGTGGGTGMAQQFQGIINWAKESGNANNTAIGAHGDFVSDATPNFGHKQMSDLMGGIPKEYFRRPNRKLVMRLEEWVALMGLTVSSSDGRRLFHSSWNAGGAQGIQSLMLDDYGLGVVLDQNMEAGTAAGQIPFFYGDLTGICLVMFGPIRVEFSQHEAFSTDQLRWKFIAYRKQAFVDTFAITGGRVT